MGFRKEIRPVSGKNQRTTLNRNAQYDVVQTQAVRFDGAKITASSSALVSMAWNAAYLLSADSSAGGAAPRVFSMAAATSGDTATIFCVSAATSNGLGVRLQAGSSAMTFDGTNDQLLFTNSAQSAEIIALSSGKAAAFCSSTGMFTASTS